ncbi:hypothetical protein A4H97_01925 [Niastella yeongjuensis]|uniref:Beta-lactamase-inhibitor-like PepSY-like domain-containing protein n=1 Tax=Niastella yeongjuensis TaxID=354355 RepID=A0A1V9EWW1_9BACT|nr:hypothetical protein [Niastella yeongjuensis]OQP50621.1 hypothetical protein A4H97_01925 [Niastella yeongjuensis]SEN25684.1 hypothetical protein SAMN05660816_00560 [Niastella yeongjuensis]
MKNVIVTISIAAVLITGSATAQQVNRPLATEGMQSLQMNTRNISRVHVRAMRDFLKRDKTASNVDWMIVETGYVARYTDKSNSNCRTVYNNRGDFVYTIRQYYENKMPRDIRSIVKREYYDYTITLVEQIEEMRKPLVYVVHLEDATTLKNVRVSERDMEVMTEYMKSKP